MLDQLVESKNNSAENTKKTLLACVLGLVAIVALVVVVGRDLFAHDFGLASGELELSTLVAPPPPDEEPPPPEEKKPEQKKAPDADLRKELIQNIMQSPVKPPDKIDTSSKVVAMRLDRKTILSDSNSDNAAAQVVRGGDVVEGKSNTFSTTPTDNNAGDGEIDVPPPAAKPTPKPAPKTISGGVLNGKAVSLPKPAYPAAARAVRASGTVTVQVLIDESGRVVSASAAGGHPLLVPAALGAARGARFSPTMLSGQAVKVSGVITYNFVP